MQRRSLSALRVFHCIMLAGRQVWALRALADHLTEDKEKGGSANINPFQQQVKQREKRETTKRDRRKDAFWQWPFMRRTVAASRSRCLFSRMQALALRSCCAEIVNTMTQPIPFPYYHTLTLMLSLNLCAYHS